jgi:gluconolactonase
MSLFPPPARIETTLFTRLPDRFRDKRRTVWGAINKGGQATDSFLEGPSFDRDGNLWVVDISHGRIFRIAPDGGEWTLIAEYDGEPNGLKIAADGTILVADYKNGVMRLDPATGAVTPLVDRYRLERFKGVNDLFLAGNGDLYFTDQGQTGMQDPTGRVFRFREGRLSCLIATVPSPNGLVTNLAETILYLAVTRANAVWRLPLMPDGGVSKVGIFVQLSGGSSGPDGMALDEQGNLFVAHCGMGSVWGFSPLGEPLWRIVSCAGIMTTNIAFDGAGNRSLFITESDTGSILRATLPNPGRRMASHL